MIQPKTIVRMKRGQPDDIAIEDVSMFRLERMAGHRWWLACYRGEKRIVFWITSKGRIDVTMDPDEDELGAVDDT